MTILTGVSYSGLHSLFYKVKALIETYLVLSEVDFLATLYRGILVNNAAVNSTLANLLASVDSPLILRDTLKWAHTAIQVEITKATGDFPWEQ